MLKYEQDTYSPLTDDAQIAVLMKKTTWQLQEPLPLNADSLSKHQEVKEVVVNYIKTKP